MNMRRSGRHMTDALDTTGFRCLVSRYDSICVCAASTSAGWHDVMQSETTKLRNAVASQGYRSDAGVELESLEATTGGLSL